MVALFVNNLERDENKNMVSATDERFLWQRGPRGFFNLVAFQVLLFIAIKLILNEKRDSVAL